MKKMIAMLFACLLFVAPVMVLAQNVPSSYNASGIGVPNYTLQSGGANYGLFQNSAAASSWSGAYGTSQTANGTAAFTWDSSPAFTANAPLVLAKTSVTGISTGTALGVASSYLVVMSTSNSAVAMLMTPSISTTTTYGGATALASGTYLVISSTGSSGVTFYDNGTLSGSQLELGAASRSVTQYKTLTLIFDATDSKWREISFGSN